MIVLVVEPDDGAAHALTGALAGDGVEHRRVRTGDDAWRALAERRPDLILVSLATADLERLHRRLRDEYMGRRPRVVALAEPAALGPEVAAYDLDAVLQRPLSPALLQPLVANRCPTLTFDLGRSREMLKLSLLGGELQASLDGLAHRLGLIYGVANCAVLALASERQWVGSVGEPIGPEHWPELWNDIDRAVSAGAPVFAALPAAAGPPLVEVRFATAIRGQTGEVLGAIGLFADAPVLFGHEARDALADLAARLGVELSWRSVHDRVTAERDHLRETAMLDPMLGVLSRGALEQALATEIARAEEGRGALTCAVIDVVGLRHLNERFGHVAGDAVLRHVADVTRRVVRTPDIVGRWGDDEIAVLLGGAGVAAASALLERVRHTLEAEPLEVAGGPIAVEIAIGLTEYRGGDDETSVLPRAARTSASARARGGSIAIADAGGAAPSGDREPGQASERYEAGVTLGGMYQIAHEISRGAMGVVYRAEDLGLSRPVALKMLRPDLVSDQQLVRRFREEAAVLAKLDHENLVRVYSFVEDRDDVFFVMELVEGPSLDNVVLAANQADEYLAADRVVSICRQVASALDAMADAGVTHRDVKPGNVVLDRTRDRAVLVDVGLARRRGEAADPAGTPGYVAPESLGGAPESAATDVYGLAATVHAMLTGQAPFGRATDYREILRRQLEEPPPPPSFHRPDLPPAVDEVVRRGLAIKARDRYSTAGEMAAALGAALGGRLVARAPRRRARASERPGTGDDGSRRTLTLDLEVRPPAGQPTIDPMTRGVVFRGVARVLGMRTLTTWSRTIERSRPALADALSLRTAALAWLPAELFDDLLSAIAATGRDQEAFARGLGGQVVVHSFRRLFPSSPESLAPATTLAALDVLWKRYHSWGALRADAVGAGVAAIVGERSRSPGACAFIEGWLEQVIAQSGGHGARVAHLRCTARGDDACEFDGRWRARASSPSGAPP